MKIDIFKVPEAELMILQILWDKEAIMSVDELTLAYNERSGKAVKPSTIHTLAERLTDKGLITYVQAGGRNLYIPVCRKEKYQAFVAAQFLKVLFNGSVAEMVYAILKDEGIDKDDWNSLMELVDMADVPQEEIEEESAETAVYIVRKPAVRKAVKTNLRKRRFIHRKRPRTYYIPRAA